MVFGVGSVVAMLAVGEGASQQAQKQIQRLGSRNILSVSSCGICGKQELDDIAVQGEALADETLLDPGALNTMFEAMRTSQDNFERTGGCHAAAAFDAEGNMLVLREDDSAAYDDMLSGDYSTRTVAGSSTSVW